MAFDIVHPDHLKDKVLFPLRWVNEYTKWMQDSSLTILYINIDVITGRVEYRNNNWHAYTDRDLFDTQELAQAECDRRNASIEDQKAQIDKYLKEIDRLKKEMAEGVNNRCE